MLRNPFAPGKNHAFSRFNSMTTLRTPGWRLIDTNGDKDLYNLSTFRYEVADVSASNPAVVSTLGAALDTPGTRPGIGSGDWAGGNPLLADPDGDGDDDGAANRLEYAAGTDGLDPADRPVPVLSFEDLTRQGLSDREMVYRFPIAADADDFTLLPATSTDLQNWDFDPLEFVDALASGGGGMELRFRVGDLSAARRFFRLEPSGE
jgi:hypothetical protein